MTTQRRGPFIPADQPQSNRLRRLAERALQAGADVASQSPYAEGMKQVFRVGNEGLGAATGVFQGAAGQALHFGAQHATLAGMRQAYQSQTRRPDEPTGFGSSYLAPYQPQTTAQRGGQTLAELAGMGEGQSTNQLADQPAIFQALAAVPPAAQFGRGPDFRALAGLGREAVSEAAPAARQLARSQAGVIRGPAARDIQEVDSQIKQWGDAIKVARKAQAPTTEIEAALEDMRTTRRNMLESVLAPEEFQRLTELEREIPDAQALVESLRVSRNPAPKFGTPERAEYDNARRLARESGKVVTSKASQVREAQGKLDRLRQEYRQITALEPDTVAAPVQMAPRTTVQTGLFGDRPAQGQMLTEFSGTGQQTPKLVDEETLLAKEANKPLPGQAGLFESPAAESAVAKPARVADVSTGQAGAPQPAAEARAPQGPILTPLEWAKGAIATHYVGLESMATTTPKLTRADYSAAMKLLRQAAKEGDADAAQLIKVVTSGQTLSAPSLSQVAAPAKASIQHPSPSLTPPSTSPAKAALPPASTTPQEGLPPSPLPAAGGVPPQSPVPPAPPATPPPGGDIPSTSGGDPGKKLTDLIRAAKPAREETAALQHEARKKQAAILAAVQGKAQGQQEVLRTQGVLKGTLPQAEFDPPNANLNQAERDTLFNQLNQSEKLRVFEKVTAANALQTVLNGRIPTINEIALLEKVFGTEFASAIMAKRPLSARIWEEVAGALNVPRALVSSVDISAPGRQGIVFAVAHPKEWAGAWGPMVRALKSEAAAKAVDEAIRTGRYAEMGEESGLYLAPRLEAATRLSAHEEAYMSRLASKIPYVRWSERAYVTFLNKLRADTWQTLIQSFERDGVTLSNTDLKELATFINRATGRGSLGPLGKGEVGAVLNATFFAPRFAMSRIQTPLSLVSKSPVVRKQAARDLTLFVGAGTSVLGLLAAAAGVTVEVDPRSSDFGKIKWGDTRYDFWGGFQPIARYTAQLLTGQRKALSNGGEQPQEMQEVIWNFLRSKFAPIPALAVDVKQGKTYAGQPVTPLGELKNLLVPLFLQDLQSAVAMYGPGGVLVAAPGAVGIGVQTFHAGRTQPSFTPSRSRSIQSRGAGIRDLEAPKGTGLRRTGIKDLEPAGAR